MPTYTKLNFADVKDLAPDYGMSDMGEARFARGALGAERIGLSSYRVNPGQRLGFGHRHDAVRGGLHRALGLGPLPGRGRRVRRRPPGHRLLPGHAMRGWEAGADGMELLAFGAHTEGENTEMDREFWTD